MDAIEMLTGFNLTRQEASIYLTLLSTGELSGYEVAKITGISRSNAYTALANLVEKGCAFVIDGSVTMYTPVKVEEFCENRIRKLQDTKKSLLNVVPEKREEVCGYITIKGQNHIVDKMKNIISQAKHRVYISSSWDIISLVAEEIEAGIKRGIKMVIISPKPVAVEGATIYVKDELNNQIRLIADSTDVLTGDIEDGENSTCLYSRKKNLVDLLKESLKNEIKLIEIMKGSNKL